MPDVKYQISSGMIDRRSKLRAAAAFIWVLITIALGGYIFCLKIIQTDPCLSPECIRAAATLFSRMDQDGNPCNDLFGHVCAHQQFELSSAETVRNHIITIIGNVPNESDWKPELLQSEFYRSCKNVEAMDKDGNNKITEIIDNFGGWPVTRGPMWERFDIEQALEISWTLGLPVEFPLRIMSESDSENLLIQAPKLTSISNSFVESVYLDLMVDTAVQFGASKHIARKDLRYSLELEKMLNKLEEELIGGSTDYETVSLQDLNEILTQINISKVLESRLLSDVRLMSSVKANIEYLKEFNLLLAGTSSRTMANFYVWKIIQSFGYYLSSPLRDNFYNFDKITGKGVVSSVTKHCIDKLTSMFPNILEKSMTNSLQERVEDVEDMTRRIKKAYNSRIDQSDWIDGKSKERIKSKLNAISLTIGNAFCSEKEVLTNLENFNFSSINVIDMIMDLNVFKRQLSIDSNVTTDLLNGYDNKNWLIGDCFYDSEQNSIHMPLSALFTINDGANLNYLKYGSLGTSIAHQIAYSVYLDFMISLEMDTMLFINQTMNETVQTLYSHQVYSRITCLDDQFNNELGEQPSMEIFSDTLGVDVAYEAYLEWVTENGEEQKLPGFTYTANQLFWINFVSQNCMTANHEDKDENEYNQRNQNLDILRNSLYFAAQFQCSSGSEMNPVDKCYII